ncbi:MAG: bacteriophage abortive infection AbiH family protein [Bacteroidales bacterium]|nr:bacteriophage abortive infection AbiH family protein [Bacteroidales bacterium]
MANLFIIGNGFDLAHGLKTSYRDFRNFLVQIEKEECAKMGEVSISEDCNLLKDDKIKYHFESIVIPAMMNALSEIANLIQLKDSSTGMTALDQLDEIMKFHDDADRIVQWIKHGSGQYYTRENNESKAIRQFIATLEPETGIITHNTNLNNNSFVFWQTMESEFGNIAMKTFQSGVGADKAPFWLTLRLFIKMIDNVKEGEGWKNLEESIGVYNFEMVFDLFKKLESNDKYKTCVEIFFTSLFYNVSELFHSWILFTQIAFEHQIVSDEMLSALRPRITKKQNGLELSFTIKDAILKENLSRIHSQSTSDRHLVPKTQLSQIFNRTKTCFFSFNYTQTLELIYGIPENNICYIHGVSRGAKNLNSLNSDDLIFGHGRETFDSNVENVVSTAYNITKKPVNQCIANNKLFFDKLEGVNNIYSYGFSFGDVDMPYVSKICNSIGDTSNVMWYLNDFDIKEHEIFKGKIKASGFIGQFDTFHID